MASPILAHYSVDYGRSPRQLARLTRLLAESRASVRSLVTACDGRVATAQFLARDIPGLRTRLEAAGMKVRRHAAFACELPSRHAALHDFAAAMAERGITIVSAVALRAGRKLKLVVAVDDPANAVECLARLGYDPHYEVT